MTFYCAPCDKLLRGAVDEVVDCPGCGMPASASETPRASVETYRPPFMAAIPFDDTGSFMRPQALSIPGGNRS